MRFSDPAAILAAGSILTQVTLAASMPFTLAKAGNIWRWLSPGGAPSVLPSTSLGLASGLLLRLKMLSGVLSNTMPTVLMVVPRPTEEITTAASARPASAWSPTANQLSAKVNFSCAEALPLAANKAASASEIVLVMTSSLFPSPFRSVDALGPRRPQTRRQHDGAVEHEPHNGNPDQRGEC